MTIETAPPEALTKLSRPQWLVVHYRREDEGYGRWSLHAWGDIAPDAITGFPDGHPFAGEDDYGRFAWVRLADTAREVGFLVVDHTGAKDVAADRPGDPAGTPQIRLPPGDPEISPSAAAAGAATGLPAEDGFAVIHYRRADGDYAGWGVHAWEATPGKPQWHAPLGPAAFDAFGA